jgi:hypothetical protein
MEPSTIDVIDSPIVLLAVIGNGDAVVVDGVPTTSCLAGHLASEGAAGAVISQN